MIRHFKIARDTAVKARSQAMLTLKSIIVSVPAALREQLDALTGKMALLRHLAALRPGRVVTTTTSAKTSLRAIARRWLALDAEIKAHDAHLEQLTQQCAPTLVEAHGIKANTAAEMLLLVGDNPERIHSEAALAKLCGSAQSRPPAVKLADNASTEVDITRRTQLFTVSLSSACETTNPRSIMCCAGPPKGRASQR